MTDTSPTPDLAAAARKVIAEYDARSLWHVVDYESLTDAMYALEAATRAALPSSEAALRAEQHRASLTLNPTFGAALWLDGRLVARIVSDIANSRVSEDDPEPQWSRDAMVFVGAVNARASSEAALREALVDVLRIFDAPFATSPTTRANVRRRAERALSAAESAERGGK